MATQRVTADDALRLAQRFHDLAVVAGDYRFEHWAQLTAAQRKTLEDLQWSLLNASSDLITQAVGIVLDTTATSVAELQQATGEAARALETVADVRRAIRIATAAVGLAAAIAAKNPNAIVTNARVVLTAISDDPAPRSAPRRTRVAQRGRAAGKPVRKTARPPTRRRARRRK